MVVLGTLALAPTATANDPDVSLMIGGPALLRPEGVAVDPAGNLWVTDTDANRVRELSPSGTPLLTFGQPGGGNGQFSQPIAIALGPDGTVYVGDFGANRIERFNSAGAFLSTFGSHGSGNGQFDGIGGIAVDSSGNVYVADSVNNRVQKFSATGQYQSQFGTTGSANGQLRAPSGIALDSAGNIYVADGLNCRVQKFDSSGQYVSAIGSPLDCTVGSGDGHVAIPSGVTVDRSGNVYIADIAFRVQKFNSAGQFQWRVGAPVSDQTPSALPGRFASPEGLAIDSAGNLYVADGANRRIEKFNSAGAYQSQIAGATFGPNGLASPAGIAVNRSGDIFVADTSSGSEIQRYNSAGVHQSHIGSLGVAGGFLNDADDVAVDGAGNMYVVEKSAHTVFKLDSTGTVLAVIGSDVLTEPEGVTVDSAGNVYVADAGTNHVQKFGPDGTPVLTIGTKGSGNGQFLRPWDVAVDSAGNLYVSDNFNHRVEKFDSTGAYKSQFGSVGSGNGQFKYPGWIAVDAADNVYVADTQNHRVEKFDSTGAYKSQFGTFGSGNGQFGTPEGIAVDAAGNAYVSDNNGNHRVEKFNSAGAYVSQFGATGSANAQFNDIRGLALDQSGHVYVVDNGNHRVQKFDPSGNYQAQFGSAAGADGTFLFPRGLAVDAGDNLYVADWGNSRIQKFDAAGTFQSKFGDANSVPTDAAIDSAGKTYVTDSLNGVIERFGPDGARLPDLALPPGTGPGQIKGLEGIALDSAGNIYVTDPVQGRVLKFDPTGVFKFEIDGFLGQSLIHPWGVTVDSKGNIYVADPGWSSVFKFNAVGSYVRFWQGDDMAVPLVSGVHQHRRPAGDLAPGPGGPHQSASYGEAAAAGTPTRSPTRYHPDADTDRTNDAAVEPQAERGEATRRREREVRGDGEEHGEDRRLAREGLRAAAQERQEECEGGVQIHQHVGGGPLSARDHHRQDDAEGPRHLQARVHGDFRHRLHGAREGQSEGRPAQMRNTIDGGVMYRLRRSFVLILGVSVALAFAPAARADHWERGPDLDYPHGLASTPTLHDGSFLVFGALGGGNPDPFSVLRYDPGSGTFTHIEDALYANIRPITVTLKDGRVLLAGGQSPQDGSHQKTAQVYDPSTDAWTPVNNTMSIGRQSTPLNPGATLLPDGRVLFASSQDPTVSHNEVDIYDPRTNAFTSAAPLHHARTLSAQTLLPDGRVLVAGGANETGAVNTGEVYDPATNTWRDTANDVPEQHLYPLLQTLANGKVLLGGGFTNVNAPGAPAHLGSVRPRDEHVRPGRSDALGPHRRGGGDAARRAGPGDGRRRRRRQPDRRRGNLFPLLGNVDHRRPDGHALALSSSGRPSGRSRLRLLRERVDRKCADDDVHAVLRAERAAQRQRGGRPRFGDGQLGGARVERRQPDPRLHRDGLRPASRSTPPAPERRSRSVGWPTARR